MRYAFGFACYTKTTFGSAFSKYTQISSGTLLLSSEKHFFSKVSMNIPDSIPNSTFRISCLLLINGAQYPHTCQILEQLLQTLFGGVYAPSKGMSTHCFERNKRIRQHFSYKQNIDSSHTALYCAAQQKLAGNITASRLRFTATNL